MDPIFVVVSPLNVCGFSVIQGGLETWSFTHTGSHFLAGLHMRQLVSLSADLGVCSVHFFMILLIMRILALGIGLRPPLQMNCTHAGRKDAGFICPMIPRLNYCVD